jgi:hypothetical protein
LVGVFGFTGDEDEREHWSARMDILVVAGCGGFKEFADARSRR